MTTYLLKFILFWLAIFAVGALIWFLYNEYRDYRKRQRFEENKYNMLYLHIKAFLEKDCTECYCRKIEADLIYLAGLKHKNPEKTHVISVEFLTKYQEYYKPDEVELIRTA